MIVKKLIQTGIISVFFLICSCSGYDNVYYQNAEDNVIQELIPELVDADYMLTHNDFNIDRPVLFLFKELNGCIDTNYSYIEKKDFYKIKSLASGKIPNRLLNDTIFNIFENLIVKVISGEYYEEKQSNDCLEEMKRNKDIFGYLSISRIIFNRQMNRGYFYYSFFCGVACAWYSMIEIKKINKSEVFFMEEGSRTRVNPGRQPVQHHHLEYHLFQYQHV